MTEQRRLAAILVADVVGYSKLIGTDEAGTLAQLQALRVEVIEPVNGYGALLSKVAEDGFDIDVVVICVVSLSIRHIGGVEYIRARKIFIESLLHQTFKVEQVPGVFLHRPAAIDLSC